MKIWNISDLEILELGVRAVQNQINGLGYLKDILKEYKVAQVKFISKDHHEALSIAYGVFYEYMSYKFTGLEGFDTLFLGRELVNRKNCNRSAILEFMNRVAYYIQRDVEYIDEITEFMDVSMKCAIGLIDADQFEQASVVIHTLLKHTLNNKFCVHNLSVISAFECVSCLDYENGEKIRHDKITESNSTGFEFLGEVH